MISISVRLFLQSLCCNSPWDYAVFWRLQQYESQMVLTWEDGLFDIEGPREFRKGITDQFYSDCFHERFSSARFSNQTANLADSPVGDLLVEMSSIYYLMGKGVVGEVAYTESPIWVYDDIIMSTRSNCSLNSECPVELFHQFVAGIKTVLLLPLLPHGVVQLGSLDMVAEDAELIIYVRNLFAAHCQLAGHFSPYRQVLVQQPELISSYMVPAAATTEMNEDIQFLGDAKVEDLKTAACTSFLLENLNCIAQADVSIVFDNESEGRNHMQLSLSDVAEAAAYPACETRESGPKQNVERSYQDDYLEAVSLFTEYEMTDCTARKLLDSYSSEGTIEPSCGSKNYDITTCNGIQFFRFPTDCELHKALASVLLDKTDLNLLHSAIPEMDASRSSVSNDDTTNGIQPSAWVSGEQFTKENNMEHLLEAVVTNTSSISDDSSFNISHFAMPSKASSGEDDATWSCLTAASGKERESKMKSTPSESSFDHIISGFIGNRPQKDASNHPPVTKGFKQIGATKRRVRHNSNQKPGPRDRQLIQDRIKELRQLIPKATKCSIDRLLDKTVKHMQFLRNVTNHAYKVRQHVRKQASDNKHQKPHIAKGINKLGTSWVLELGSEQQDCPIIVKDLGHPGHMLIEMLCNDNGRFMEIADVVHRLGLTILKGVMERRSDVSTWAHFVVEAPESFHRLDIFWPLMQLLQHNQTQISSKS